MLAQLTNKFTNDNQEDNEKLQEIHNEIITTFQRVSCTDEFSEIVGTKGMSEIMGSYDNHVNIDLSGTADYVANLFNLVSQLAFHKANLKYILQSGKNTTLYTNVLNQHSSLFIMRLCESVVSSSLTILLLFFILFYSLGSGGIKNSINAVSRFSNDPNVILHAIQVIDNCTIQVLGAVGLNSYNIIHRLCLAADLYSCLYLYWRLCCGGLVRFILGCLFLTGLAPPKRADIPGGLGA